MGNICKTCKLCSKERKNITILLTGLDNGGKTTIARMLAGEPTDSVLSTIGFSLVELNYHGFKITLYDLGGSSNIRDIWNKYYMDAYGIIYVVDGSDTERLEESKQVFADILSHENISGKHVLLLAHKQDKDNALDELEIVEHMNLEFIVNKYRCPTRVEASTAITLETFKIDKGLKNGIRWLVDSIIQNYKAINERVQRDMENYMFLVEKSRDEWRNKINSKIDATEDTTVVENENPFQPVDSIITKAKENTPCIENGNVIKHIMIDNFMEDRSRTSNTSQKTENNATTSVIATITQPLQEQKIKLKNHYRKHRKKFGMFNKTAPMPIGTMMREKSIDIEFNEVSNKTISGSCTNYAEKKTGVPKSYLIRRPATAPPKINFTKSKVGTAWNLTTPLDNC